MLNFTIYPFESSEFTDVHKAVDVFDKSVAVGLVLVHSAANCGRVSAQPIEQLLADTLLSVYPAISIRHFSPSARPVHL